MNSVQSTSQGGGGMNKKDSQFEVKKKQQKTSTSRLLTTPIVGYFTLSQGDVWWKSVLLTSDILKTNYKTD